jgi:hypothetical protein
VVLRDWIESGRLDADVAFLSVSDEDAVTLNSLPTAEPHFMAVPEGETVAVGLNSGLLSTSVERSTGRAAIAGKGLVELPGGFTCGASGGPWFARRNGQIWVQHSVISAKLNSRRGFILGPSWANPFVEELFTQAEASSAGGAEYQSSVISHSHLKWTRKER